MQTCYFVELPGGVSSTASSTHRSSQCSIRRSVRTMRLSPPRNACKVSPELKKDLERPVDAGAVEGA